MDSAAASALETREATAVLAGGRDLPARGGDLAFDLRKLAVQVVADVDRLLPLDRLGVRDRGRAVAVHGVHGLLGRDRGGRDGHDVVVAVERDLEVLGGSFAETGRAKVGADVLKEPRRLQHDHEARGGQGTGVVRVLDGGRLVADELRRGGEGPAPHDAGEDGAGGRHDHGPGRDPAPPAGQDVEDGPGAEGGGQGFPAVGFVRHSVHRWVIAVILYGRAGIRMAPCGGRGICLLCAGCRTHFHGAALHELVLERVVDELRVVGHPHLVEQPRPVGAHGLDAERELAGDRAHGLARGDEPQDQELAVGEALVRGGLHVVHDHRRQLVGERGARRTGRRPRPC